MIDENKYPLGREGFSQMQEDAADALDDGAEPCGCTTSWRFMGHHLGNDRYTTDIFYCPMHKAAPVMLVALVHCESAMDMLNGEDSTAHRPCRFCLATQYDGAVGIIHDAEDCDILEARKAIAQARGKEAGA